MRKSAILAVALLFAALSGPAAAQSEIVAHVSISKQTMTVSVDGAELYTWPVSTARPGYRTPTGNYRVQSMRKMHYSSLFNNAPMPFSIFFYGHYAIHGTNEVRKLGQPASAGCIRLHTDHARALFELVRDRGPESFQVLLES